MSRTKQGQSVKRKLTTTLLVAAMALAALGSPASASPQGYLQDQLGVGYFYGTFNQSPNIVLLVGGPVEEFCDEDPGIAPVRVFLRSDGSVDLKVNDKHQPIYLYNIDFDGAPPWIDQVCAASFNGDPPPEPFATGTADLRVRLSVVSDDYVEVFNSVNGKATGIDGTEYKVRAWADLVVENGVPVGNPEDFVGFELKEIRR